MAHERTSKDLKKSKEKDKEIKWQGMLSIEHQKGRVNANEL